MTRSIADRMNDPDPEGWRPEVGDTIIGTIEDIGSRISDFNGEPYPILTIAQEDGSVVAVHAFHSVLKNEIDALNPSIGDEIGVRYDGPKEPKGGLKKGMSAYESYRVRLDRKSPAGSSVPTPPRAQSIPESERAASSDDFMGDEPF